MKYTEHDLSTAAHHVQNILGLAIQHSPAHDALVVWDGQCALSLAITDAYKRCLPEATFIEFDAHEPAAIRAEFAKLAAGDLVVLVQSTSFRLDAFRIRVELFKLGLKVIEHPHLSRMPGEEGRLYIDSLAYDAEYFRNTGAALKARIDQASCGIVDSGGAQLVFGAGFEDAKLNVGDYRQMNNVGGQFPIGEVFTESRDLEAVNGKVRVSIFGDTQFAVNKPPVPITLEISKGRVVGVEDSTAEFDKVLELIRAEEGEIWLRELGLGLNRAFSPERMVSDIGTFERMCGIHFSLGAKHGSYNKPNIRRADAKFHVDVFAATETVTLDEEVVFSNGAWLVS